MHTHTPACSRTPPGSSMIIFRTCLCQSCIRMEEAGPWRPYSRSIQGPPASAGHATAFQGWPFPGPTGPWVPSRESGPLRMPGGPCLPAVAPGLPAVTEQEELDAQATLPARF